jgi:hypothetical protein
MATLMQLVRGTQTVLPIAMIRYMDGMNVVESIRVTTFLGTKMKIVTSTVRASGRHPRKPESGETPDQAYIVQLAFYGVDEKTSSPTNNVGVRCSCKAYYFWMSWANMGNVARLELGSSRTFARRLRMIRDTHQRILAIFLTL